MIEFFKNKLNNLRCKVNKMRYYFLCKYLGIHTSDNSYYCFHFEGHDTPLCLACWKELK
jgi:hypothetical protein